MSRQRNDISKRNTLCTDLELAADGGEGEVEAAVLEALLELVHRFAAPPEAAKHAARLGARVGVLQDCAQCQLQNRMTET